MVKMYSEINFKFNLSPMITKTTTSKEIKNYTK
jgi:hypothetical protein